MLEAGFSSSQSISEVPQSAASGEAPPNAAPVFSASPAANLKYTENETRAIDAAMTLTDDCSKIAGVKIEITGGYVKAEDRLLFVATASTGDIRIALDKDNKPINQAGKMLLESPSGNATIAQWQAAVQAVSYNNASENPTTAARTFTFSASDGTLIGTTTRAIDIVRVNDAPTASTSAEQTVGAEDSIISGRVYAGSDPDGDKLTYVLEGTPEGVTLNADGTWTYTPPKDFAGTSSFAYRVSDGTLTSAPKTVNIIVEAVSETPTPHQYVYDGLYFDFGGSTSGGFNKKVGDTIYLEIGGSASLDFDVGFGLVVSAVVPDNEVEIKYGIDLVEKVSDVEYTLNKQSYVDTSDWKQGESSITSNGVDPADLQLAVDLKAALKAKLDFAFNIGGGISIDFGSIDFGPFGTLDLGSIDESFSESFGGTILDVNTSGSLRLLSLSGDQLSYTKEFSVGSISAKLPDAIVQSSSTIITDGDKYGNLSTKDHSDSMLSANLDLDAIVATVLGLPSNAFGGSYQADVGPFYGKLSYDIISAALVGGIALEQEYSFKAGDVDVKMTSNFGPEAATNGQVVNSQTKTGKLGENYTFDTPQGEGTFTVTATYVLDGVLTSKVGLYGKTSFDYSLLGATVGAGVYVDFELATLDESFELGFGPVLKDSLAIVEGSLVTLFTTEDDIELTLFTRTYTIEYENFYIGEDNKDDVFTMTRRQVEADGKSGNDKITGNALDNIIQLGEGNDYGWGRAGADKIYGGNGNDEIEGEAGADLLDGGDGNDFLKGGTEDDELIGGLGDDRLEGGADNDKLFGNAGKDYLAGEDGDDMLDGGADDDQLEGGNNNDKLFGVEGDDILNGGAGEDELDGGIGNDKLDGGSENDKLLGREGDDLLLGGTGNDYLDGGTGADRLDGGANDDQLYGSDGDDVLIGGSGVDMLDGGLDNDQLDGGSENDKLYGYIGEDYLLGGTGDDLLDGGAGNDTMDGGADNDKLIGWSGDDLLFGGIGDDELDGGSGLDRIFGGVGADKLFGGAGNDIIDGGAGVDTLKGESGNDIFTFLSAADIGTKGAGLHDIITDFTQGYDKIDLSAIYGGNRGYALRTDANRMESLTGAGNRAYDVSFWSEGGKTYVAGDTTGDGLADFTLELNGTIKLKATDFIVTQPVSTVSSAGAGGQFAMLHQSDMLLL